MQFEWDTNKNEATKKDRNLSFEEATHLWYSDGSIEVPAKTDGELRWAKIGILSNKVHVCIFTYRGEKIRIISVRRAHPNEEKQYEKAKTLDYK